MPNTAPQPITLADLEAYVSSPAYTPAGADRLAAQIPQLREKAAGAPGEHIAPGITRIRGNLCNVHGRYGPCDKALSGKKPAKGRKPRAAAKPKKVALTPEQRQQARDAQHAQNQANTLTKLNIAPDGQAALAALRNGDQPDPAAVARGGFEDAGLVERAQDGSYRLTASGRAALSASQSGDAGRAGSTISSARDRVAARRTRQQVAADRKQQAQAKRDARLAKQGKRPSAETNTTTVPTGTPKRASTPTRRAMPKAGAHVQAPKGTAPAKPAPSKAPTKQVAPALRDAAAKLSDGTASDDQVQTLVRNGLAKLNKDGQPVLTAAGLRATQKAAPFTVFKDARGHYRWLAFSSTAYRDRDGEIVSTKALADDCARADRDGGYGVLDWWHMPSIVLGDCDFNAMHGRVLIESGTFRSPQIAEKVARAAPDLELSIAFLHPHTEPDAQGVFHSIHRFARGLTPRGRASNRFTSFHVKESPMDETKKAALKMLGFSDGDIGDLEARAIQTQKAADAQGVAFKAAEPDAPPDLVINGVTYKAFPPKVDDPAAEPEVKADAAPIDDTTIVDDELPEEDAGGLTLSPEDLQAIRQAMGIDELSAKLDILTQALDLVKTMNGHVEKFGATLGTQQTQKDAERAETQQQVAALQSTQKETQEKLNELLGLQPEGRVVRATDSATSQLSPTNLNDLALLAAAKSSADPHAVDPTDPWQIVRKGLGVPGA